MNIRPEQQKLVKQWIEKAEEDFRTADYLLTLKEGITKDRIVVQLSSCITKDNFHAPPCPQLDYLKALIAKLGLDVCEDTFINEKSEARRKAGLYKMNMGGKK